MEYHAHRTSEVRDVMASGQGARANPIEIIITTAGLNTTSQCKKHRDTCVEILQGYKEDEHQFSLIYELDEEDDWLDENVWIKAAPNMNVTVDKKFISRMINQAKLNPSKLVEVKTKILNLWVDSADTWIPSECIESNMQDITWEDFRGQDVIVGVDLSAVSDLTAVSFMYHDLEKDKLVFKTNYYLPEAALESKGDVFFYNQCRKQDHLIITSGNVIDYRYIINDINKVRDEYGANINTVAYDKYNSTQWALEMQDEGYELLDFSQSLSSFNRPTKELERLIMSNRVIIDKNEMTRYCFNNVVLKYDHNFNCKPDKEKSAKKIDGTIAMCQCVGGYLFNDNILTQVIAL